MAAEGVKLGSAEGGREAVEDGVVGVEDSGRRVGAGIACDKEGGVPMLVSDEDGGLGL